MGHLTYLDLSRRWTLSLDGDFSGQTLEKQEETARKGFY
jgi:hypothetical protein